MQGGNGTSQTVVVIAPLDTEVSALFAGDMVRVQGLATAISVSAESAKGGYQGSAGVAHQFPGDFMLRFQRNWCWLLLLRRLCPLFP